MFQDPAKPRQKSFFSIKLDMITEGQVLEAQNEWGAGVVKIGSLKDQREECESFASDFLDKMYAFDLGTVLFKPTKCAVEQFRA